MLLAWRNGILNVGAQLYRGPHVTGVALYWNRREDIEGVPPPEGETLFMDGIELGVASRAWHRRRYRPYFSRWKM